jgi:hypothetical protein
MNYSRRQLEAFGEPLGESVTRLKPGGRIYGGGGGGPSSTTVNQSNIPDWLRPQVEQVLGGATKELFKTTQTGVDADGKPIYDITGTKDFTPYSTDPSKYVAGFSPLQQQVQYNAANLQMPGQFNQATGFANAAGQGALDSAQKAYGYGQAGFESGMAGQNYANQVAGQAGAQAAGYGNAGFQSGQTGQNLGMQGGQYYGEMGAGYGQQGANLGVQGGQYYGSQGAGYGSDAASLAGQAQGYGQNSANIGLMGLRAEQYGRNVSSQAEDYARQAANAQQNYVSQMTDPYAIQQYMNPYQSAVTDVQIQGAQRQADIAAQTRKSQAARAGAYGGARQAIENAEANRALASQMDAIRAQGQQAAYDKAVQAMQYGSNLGLQGLQGAQSGLGTALQGGQLGLSGIGQAMQGQQAGLQGLSTANQLYGTGIQGAGMGLQGVNAQLAGTAQGMQGAQAGLAGVDRQLAGTAQGMQGAQVGLQGVGQQLAAGQLGLQGYQTGMQGAQAGLAGVTGAQAGYGLANQSASNLANIGTQQLAGQTGILNLQNQIGAQQQGREQQIINQDIQNFANQQNAPMDSLNQFNALLRGYALPGTTTTQYQAQPTLANQLAGYGTAAVGAAQLAKIKKGGTVRSGISDLALYNATH